MLRDIHTPDAELHMLAGDIAALERRIAEARLPPPSIGFSLAFEVESYPDTTTILLEWDGGGNSLWHVVDEAAAVQTIKHLLASQTGGSAKRVQ